MPNLPGILKGIWLRNGPLLNLLILGREAQQLERHRHPDILEGLRARDAEHTRSSVHADLEAGRGLVRRPEGLEPPETGCARIQPMV